jgi:hypothetical protein
MAAGSFRISITGASNLERLRPYIIDGAIDLQILVVEMDTLLINEGYEPYQRPLEACARIADKLGVPFVINGQNSDLVEAVHFVYESLYSRQNFFMPPMHIGTVMFRDIFLPLRIPIIYGRCVIDPIKSLHDVPENTIRWIFQSDEAACTLIDQWIDLFDFVYGLSDLSKLQKHSSQAIEFWQLAKQQLEGAAATLLGPIDKYTVIQNSIIAMELLVKGVLLVQGETEASIKKYGHNMGILVDKACEFMPHADCDRLKLDGSKNLPDRP